MAGKLSITWPSQAEPAKITKSFDASTGKVGISAPKGTKIIAGVAGKIQSTTTSTVEIAAGAYTLTYAGLQNIQVQAGQEVKSSDIIGESAEVEAISLVVQQVIDPTSMLQMPSIPPKEPEPDTKKLYVIPIETPLRFREKPVDGTVIGQLGPLDALEVLEARADAEKKIGVKDQWLKVKTLAGKEGYVAAWFVKVYTGKIPPEVPITIPGLLNITGMNLDIDHPLGRPDPARLKGMGWVRFLYNVSFNPDKRTYGNQDIDYTYNRYKPVLERYAKTGLKVLLVFTHQTYGEGAGYNWGQMDSNRWKDLTAKFADMLRRIAQQYKDQNIVHAFQIWNEQDAHAGAEASVTLPPADYGHMLAETIKAVRAVDPNIKIITGGHTGGPQKGSKYARDTIAAMPAGIRPDGIAIHPYGRGPEGAPKKYMHFGKIDEEIEFYGPILPDKPLWFTEWGVLNASGEPAAEISKYATAFVNHLKTQYPGKVTAAMWYAWAMGMHNGYGLVAENDQPKQPLLDNFLKA